MWVWFVHTQRILTVQSSRDWPSKKNIVSNINSYFLQSDGDKFKSHSCSSNAGTPIGCPHHSVDESKSNRMMKRMPMLWWWLKVINNSRYHKRSILLKVDSVTPSEYFPIWKEKYWSAIHFQVLKKNDAATGDGALHPISQTCFHQRAESNINTTVKPAHFASALGMQIID